MLGSEALEGLYLPEHGSISYNLAFVRYQDCTIKAGQHVQHRLYALLVDVMPPEKLRVKSSVCSLELVPRTYNNKSSAVLSPCHCLGDIKSKLIHFFLLQLHHFFFSATMYSS